MTLDWRETEVVLTLSRMEWQTLFRLLLLAVERLSLKDLTREEARRARLLFTRLRDEFVKAAQP